MTETRDLQTSPRKPGRLFLVRFRRNLLKLRENRLKISNTNYRGVQFGCVTPQKVVYFRYQPKPRTNAARTAYKELGFRNVQY